MPRRAIVLILMMATMLVVPQVAYALAPDGYGWWWRGNQVPDELHPYIGDTPHPDAGPPDGLMIEHLGGGDSGIAAIAALEFIVQGGGDVDLTLIAAEGWSFTGANINACIVDGSWNPALNGQWHHRPAYDCEGFAAEGVPNAEASRMTWRLTPRALLDPTTYNVVLVPFGGSGFQVATNRPESGTLSGFKVPKEDSQPPFDPGPPPPAFEDNFAEFAEPEPLVPEPEVAPEIEIEEPEIVPTAAPIPKPVEDFIERILAAGTLAAILAGLWFMSARQGRGLADTAGGIGRFSRRRETPPIRL